MNTFRIALKEFRQDFRDWRTLLFMLALPVALMLILGFALTNAFGSQATVDNIKVLVQDNSGGGPVAQAFQAFAAETAKSGIKFEMAKPGTNGREEVEQNHYVEYAELTDSGITLYNSSRNAIESNIAQGMLTAFADGYKLVTAVAPSDASQIERLFPAAADHTYIKETSLDADRQPGSIDYYAMAMAVMVGMLAAMSACGLIAVEIKTGTAVRLVAAPVRKSEIFAGKVLGSIVLNMACVLIVVLFSKFVFKAYWGDHLGLVIAVLLSEVAMAVSFGLAASYVLKGTASRVVVMLVTQLASFFGGAYFPIGDDGGSGVMGFLVQLSPIRWVNHALTNIIYDHQLAAGTPVVILNAAIAVLLLTASAVMMNRREGI